MSEIADDEPIEARRLAGYFAGGRCWVVVDDLGAPVGYVVVDVVDRAAHVEQLSVVPSHQGRGLGAALLDTVQQWARARTIEEGHTREAQRMLPFAGGPPFPDQATAQDRRRRRHGLHAHRVTVSAWS